MDESEKRMERLKAMRNEAAEGEALSANQVTRVSGFQSGLANPLTDASPLQERSRSAHRFDYYTDPMASFYANRKGHVDSHVPRGFVLNPGHVLAPPVRQMLPHPEQWNPVVAMNPFPRPITYQRGVRPFNASFSYRPFGSENPYISHQEFPPGIRNLAHMILVQCRAEANLSKARIQVGGEAIGLRTKQGWDLNREAVEM